MNDGGGRAMGDEPGTMRKPLTLADMPEELRAMVLVMVASGDITPAEVEEALAFYNELANAEVNGALSPIEATLVAEQFAEMQVAKGTRS